MIKVSTVHTYIISRVQLCWMYRFPHNSIYWQVMTKVVGFVVILPLFGNYNGGREFEP